jgi:uncharacterized membrane protein YbhN (UPF0104 family)
MFKSKITFSIKAILILVVCYFVYLKLSENWADVIQYDWSINYELLLLSLLVHLFALLIMSYVWVILISGFGYNVKLKDAFKISYIANLGRYIPGRIWPVFGMAYLAKQIKIEEQTSITSWIVAQFFSLPSAFLLGVVCVLLSPELLDQAGQFLSGSFYLISLLIIILSLLMIFFPAKALGFLNILLRKFKKPEVSFELSVKTALSIYIGYIIGWFVYGLSFWLLIISVTSNFDISLITAVGSFVLAYQIGYLAIITPGGIGVRELVLTVILNPYLGVLSASIAVAARIWNLIVEITAALIASFIKLTKIDS